VRAAVIREFGRPPAIEDVAEPRTAGVLARVLAAAMTPVDHRVADGLFPVKVTLPYVTGKEGVAEIIDGNERLPAGTRVYFEFPPNVGGAFAERIALSDGDFAVEIPHTIDVRQAAALGGSVGITAWSALEWTAKLQAGETVLVLGATGPLGSAAVAIAKILGAGRVVAAGRNAGALERCLAAGADAIVNVNDEKDRLADAFREATNGGPNVIFDPLSGSMALAALHAARFGARLVQIGSSAGDLTIPAAIFVAKALSVTGYSNYITPAPVRKQSYLNILANIGRGTIRAVVEPRPLAEIASVWEATKSPAYAKFVIEPNA
jgi:NADPH:quinone reductase-like Zn-dependent oxidoreductase